MQKPKVYQIRFNTVSKSENDRWRIIEDGNEVLVSNIIIDGHTYTTKDWIEEINDWKWHISCSGHCEIKNNVLHPLFQRCLKQGIQFKQRWLTHIARRLNHKSVISAKSMNTHSEKVKS